MKIHDLNVAGKPLKSLCPLGTGTDMYESLGSYACRLADMHRVPRNVFDHFVMTGEHPTKRVRRIIAVDQPDVVARDYAVRLAELVDQPEVAYLGTSGLQNFDKPRLLVAPKTRWCSACLGEQWNAGLPLHYPQLWTLSDYTVCHIHGYELDNRCLHCETFNGYNERWTKIHRNCRSCAAPLADADLSFGHRAKRPKINPESGFEPYIQMVTGPALAEFVGVLPKMAKRNIAPKVDLDFLSLKHLGGLGLESSDADLARMSGHPPKVVHATRHKEYLSFQWLLDLSVACEVSLAGLIWSECWSTTASGFELERTPVDGNTNWPSGPSGSVAWGAVEETVRRSLMKKNASLEMTAILHGLCAKQLALKLARSHYHRVATKRILLVSPKQRRFEATKDLVRANFKDGVVDRGKVARRMGVSDGHVRFGRAFREVQAEFDVRHLVPIVRRSDKQSPHLPRQM